MPRQPSQNQTLPGAKAGTRAISAPTADEALLVLVRLLARQVAHDWQGGPCHPVDQTYHEEKIHDQA